MLFNNKQKEKERMIQKISDMLNAGIPLRNILKGIADSGDRNAREAGIVYESIMKGETLLNAFEKAYTLNDVEKSLLSSSGISNIKESMNAICEHYNYVRQFRSELLNVFVRPMVTLVAAIFILSILSFYVVPKIQASLPTEKVGMLDVFGAVKQALIFLFTCGGILVALTLTLRFMDIDMYIRFIVKLPFVGTVRLKRAIFIFLKNVSIITKGGTSISKAMDVAMDTSPVFLKVKIKEALKAMEKEGKSIRDAFIQQGIFPFYVIDLIETAEKTGKYSECYDNASELVRREFERARSAVLPMVEFGALGLTAVIIVFAFMSIISPLQNMGGLLR